MQKKLYKKLSNEPEAQLKAIHETDTIMKQNSECRICRISEAKSSVFENNLHETFMELTQIQIKISTIYNRICLKCVQTLNDFQNFRKLCIESYKFYEGLEPDLAKDEIKLEENYVEGEPFLSESIIDQSTEIHVKPVIKVEMETVKGFKTEPSTQRRNLILICDICFEEFRNKTTIRDHMRKFHIQGQGTPTIEDLTCNLCSKIFPTRRKLSTHKFRHRKKESACPHCGILVKNMTTHLKRHTEEFERQMFQCDKCPKKYKSKYQLLSHLKEHENKEYPCPICGRPFNHPSKIREHVKVHNPNRPKFECEQCGKLFSFKKVLTGHRRTHTDERPFECEICGMAFRLSGTMKKHLFTHTGYRPYPCQHCDFGSYTKSNLRDHMKRLHPNVIITF